MKDFLEYIDNHISTDSAVFVSATVLSAMIALVVLIGVPYLFAQVFGIHPIITLLIMLTCSPLVVLIYKYRKQK